VESAALLYYLFSTERDLLYGLILKMIGETQLDFFLCLAVPEGTSIFFVVVAFRARKLHEHSKARVEVSGPRCRHALAKCTRKGARP
jgi:hypothetical protein